MKNLTDGIADLNAIPEIQRIFLSIIELKTILDEVLCQMAYDNKKLIKYLRLPIPWGSDYTARRVREVLMVSRYLSLL
jgi:tRNA A37 methylthiotransferase MiaB